MLTTLYLDTLYSASSSRVFTAQRNSMGPPSLRKLSQKLLHHNPIHPPTSLTFATFLSSPPPSLSELILRGSWAQNVQWENIWAVENGTLGSSNLGSRPKFKYTE
jgi:hypothetical protein